MTRSSRKSNCEGHQIFAGCTDGSVNDISSSFWHIDLTRAEESKRYCGFFLDGEWYRFEVLPMVIHSAPYVFRTVLKPAVAHWRSRYIKVLPFCDDITSAAKNKLVQRLHAFYIKEHLISLGFLIQDKKLVGMEEPLPTITALGTVISFPDQKFYLPGEKVRKTVDLVSASHCLVPAARIHTRGMCDSIFQRLSMEKRERGLLRGGWDGHINLTDVLKN